MMHGTMSLKNLNNYWKKIINVLPLWNLMWKRMN